MADPCSIVVTRPLRQALEWTVRFESMGYPTILFPTVEIVPYDIKDLQKQILKLAGADIIILSSPNSVYALPEDGVVELKKNQGTIVSMGKGTTQALVDRGILPQVTGHDGVNSEALLKYEILQEKNVTGKRVVIVTGKDGRQVLQRTLQKRGALIFQLQTYYRSCPKVSKELNQSLLNQTNLIFIITSLSALLNLKKILGFSKENWLNQQRILVISQRIEQAALEIGFKLIYRSKSVNFKDIVTSLKEIQHLSM